MLDFAYALENSKIVIQTLCGARAELICTLVSNLIEKRKVEEWNSFIAQEGGLYLP